MQTQYSLPPHGFVNYVDRLGCDRAIAQAARQSYNSVAKNEEADRMLIYSLYRRRHTSPFEQASITFHIRMPIFVMRQFVRHRTNRLNEFSARYKEMPEEFYLPRGWRVQHATEKQATVERTFATLQEQEHWNANLNALAADSYHQAYKTYKAMIAQGACREQARMVLPLGIYTEITVNIDMHNIMNLFRQRLDSHAQAETRDVVVPMFEIAEALFPWTIAAFRRYPMRVIDSETENGQGALLLID